MPKLFNTIIVYDVYSYAENQEDARAAAMANIADGLPPSTQTAIELGRQSVRDAWLNQSPLVGPAVSDEDFNKIKGKTCEQVWAEANTKAKAAEKAK